ncbi:arylformamidase [Desulfobaculum xiamenense]|uniref:Arylformamidase n=1 Tax=Desulfobaculum xiamenense TaxID=995050 RepID=A0A846QN84_9BACT|nr:cyclase family protein [Desulfobaculum xiamenense]NJB68480.1 arylformamidase [Desulfobaculum xiamenense]
MTIPGPIIDITLALGREDAPWPGDRPFALEGVPTSPCGGRTSTLTMSAHCGTHIDTPAHVMDAARTLGDYAPADFLLPAIVVDVGDAALVTAQLLQDAAIHPGDAVLLRTRNTRHGLPGDRIFRTDFTALAPSAARLIVERGARLAGIDGPSADPFDAEDLPAHHILLGAGLPIIENLNLHAATPGRYILCCLPLSIPDAEASPVRAVLWPDTPR